MNRLNRKFKILLVSSRGGHLYELYCLKKWWGKYDRIWYTRKGSDVSHLLAGEKTYYGYFPESHNVFNAVRNFWAGFWLIYKESPDLIVSCGAGVAPPVFLAGKLLKKHLLFMDSIAFVDYPSLSAKMISLFADKILVQHRGMVKKIRKAAYWGSIL
jgi:UDP-N-acetylglucosamine:LPS N-acetylglucosamine transferase